MYGESLRQLVRSSRRPLCESILWLTKTLSMDALASMRLINQMRNLVQNGDDIEIGALRILRDIYVKKGKGWYAQAPTSPLLWLTAP